MPTPLLILASTSPYRRQALQRLGLSFKQIAPDCDEEALKDPQLAPAQLAASLARAKAQSLQNAHPEAIIMGSDQIAECNGSQLGKPGTVERAQAQLRQLSGRDHRLFTAVCILSPSGMQEHCDQTTLSMRSLSETNIARYIALDQPLNCAGSYKIEGAGIALFSAISSADHTAITGLPLIALCGMLGKLGIAIP